MEPRYQCSKKSPVADRGILRFGSIPTYLKQDNGTDMMSLYPCSTCRVKVEAPSDTWIYNTEDLRVEEKEVDPISRLEQNRRNEARDVPDFRNSALGAVISLGRRTGVVVVAQLPLLSAPARQVAPAVKSPDTETPQRVAPAIARLPPPIKISMADEFRFGKNKPDASVWGKGDQRIPPDTIEGVAVRSRIGPARPRIRKTGYGKHVYRTTSR